MKNIHGGNIYDNKTDLDFSVNISPLGMPDKVKDVIVKSVDSINNYPDMECKDLKDKLGEKYGITPSFFLIGNGSSEIFMAIAHSKPGAKALIIVPSFYGYEYAFSFIGLIASQVSIINPGLISIPYLDSTLKFLVGLVGCCPFFTSIG